MNYLKWLIKFTESVIIKNKLKLLILITIITSFFFAGTFPDETATHKIIHQLTRDKNYLYIEEGIRNNRIEYEVLSFSKPQDIVDGILTTKEYNEINVLFWILFGISLFILILTTFVTWDTGDGWEIKECKELAFLSLVECEFEGGKYYYTCCGKLLGSKENKVAHQYILGEFRVRGFDELKTCPEFQTKTKKRNKSLEELGI
jgi:hypothetical protein